MLAVSGVLLVSATKLPRLGCDASGPCVRSTCLCIHSRRWTHSFAAYDTWPYCARDMYVNPRAYYVAPCSLHVFRALCCVSSSSITHALPEGASLCVVSPVAWYSSQAGTGSRQRRDRDVSRVACLRTGRGGPHLHETALSRSERAVSTLTDFLSQKSLVPTERPISTAHPAMLAKKHRQSLQS